MNPKQESEALLNAIFPLAEQMLKCHEFRPYGGYMKLDGRIIQIVKDGDNDHSLSEELIDVMRSAFREMARVKECKAVALVCNARVGPPGCNQQREVIKAFLDHVDGYSVEVFFPYHIVDGEIEYAEIYTYYGKHEIFGKPTIH